MHIRTVLYQSAPKTHTRLSLPKSVGKGYMKTINRSFRIISSEMICFDSEKDPGKNDTVRNGRNPAIFAVVFAVGGCQTVFVGRTSGINNNVVVIIEVHQVIQHHHTQQLPPSLRHSILHACLRLLPRRYLL